PPFFRDRSARMSAATSRFMHNLSPEIGQKVGCPALTPPKSEAYSFAHADGAAKGRALTDRGKMGCFGPQPNLRVVETPRFSRGVDNEQERFGGRGGRHRGAVQRRCNQGGRRVSRLHRGLAEERKKSA